MKNFLLVILCLILILIFVNIHIQMMKENTQNITKTGPYRPYPPTFPDSGKGKDFPEINSDNSLGSIIGGIVGYAVGTLVGYFDSVVGAHASTVIEKTH